MLRAAPRSLSRAPLRARGAVTIACVLACASASPALMGCGGTTGAGPGRTHAPRAARPIRLTLTTAEGQEVRLEDQRGTPVLLVVLATYDGVSQAAMRPLSRFARHNEGLLVLGVLAQPDARTFAPLFEEATDSSFAITWDPDDTITRGTSDLGPLDAVPTYYRIGPDGILLDQHVGYLGPDDLARFME